MGAAARRTDLGENGLGWPLYVDAISDESGY